MYEACKFNLAINCDTQTECNKCGWNPNASATRNNKSTENPYWKRIQSVAERQRAKGIETYGQGIESNPAALHDRIEMALEELIDLAMYLCWVEDSLKNKRSADGGKK